MSLPAALLIAAALSACAAKTPRAAQFSEPDRYPPARMIGKAHIRSPQFNTTLDLALLLDPQSERARLDLVLPTGASAAILWLLPDRWLLLDPAASVAYTGRLAQVAAMMERLPDLYKAPLMLISGLKQLNPRWGFGRIVAHTDREDAAEPQPASLPGTAATSSTWRVGIAPDHPDFSPPWSRQWLVASQQLTLEVTWLRVQLLHANERRLFKPLLPESVSLRSWQSLVPPPGATTNLPTVNAPLP